MQTEPLSRHIHALPTGKIFFTEELYPYGNPSQVKVALHRAVRSGALDRLAHGIYVKPRYDPVLGKILPDIEELARAIARRDKIRLLPSGAFAMYKLGMTTQVPTRLVYLTDGSPRTIRVGKQSIQLKKTTPKILSMKGPISSLVVQALREIGKGNMTPEQQEKLVRWLRMEKPELIRHDMALAPHWIARFMNENMKDEF